MFHESAPNNRASSYKLLWHRPHSVYIRHGKTFTYYCGGIWRQSLCSYSMCDGCRQMPDVGCTNTMNMVWIQTKPNRRYGIKLERNHHQASSPPCSKWQRTGQIDKIDYTNNSSRPWPSTDYPYGRQTSGQQSQLTIKRQQWSLVCDPFPQNLSYIYSHLLLPSYPYWKKAGSHGII